MNLKTPEKYVNKPIAAPVSWQGTIFVIVLVIITVRIEPPVINGVSTRQNVKTFLTGIYKKTTKNQENLPASRDS